MKTKSLTQIHANPTQIIADTCKSATICVKSAIIRVKEMKYIMKKLISIILILAFALQSTNAWALRSRSASQSPVAEEMRGDMRNIGQGKEISGAMHAAVGEQVAPAAAVNEPSNDEKKQIVAMLLARGAVFSGVIHAETLEKACELILSPPDHTPEDLGHRFNGATIKEFIDYRAQDIAGFRETRNVLRKEVAIRAQQRGMEPALASMIANMHFSASIPVSVANILKRREVKGDLARMAANDTYWAQKDVRSECVAITKIVNEARQAAEKEVDAANIARKAAVFNGVARVVKEAAGHGFDLVIYPSSGTDMMAAAALADNIVTIDEEDFFRFDDRTTAEARFNQTLIDKTKKWGVESLKNIIKQKLQYGMEFSNTNRGFQYYAAELILLGVDLRTLKVVERKVIAAQDPEDEQAVTMTTLEFELNGRTIRHTHFSVTLDKRLESDVKGADKFVRDQLVEIMEGKNNIAALSKAPASKDSFDPFTTMTALYPVLPKGTVVLADEELDSKMREDAQLDSIKTQETAAGFGRLQGFEYGYAENLAEELNVYKVADVETAERKQAQPAVVEVKPAIYDEKLTQNQQKLIVAMVLMMEGKEKEAADLIASPRALEAEGYSFNAALIQRYLSYKKASYGSFRALRGTLKNAVLSHPGVSETLVNIYFDPILPSVMNTLKEKELEGTLEKLAQFGTGPQFSGAMHEAKNEKQPNPRIGTSTAGQPINYANILQGKQVMVCGENHLYGMQVEEILESLNSLKAIGVKYIGFEMILTGHGRTREQLQELINKYYATGDEQNLNAAIVYGARHLSSMMDPGSNQAFTIATIKKIIKKSRELGIKILAIDASTDEQADLDIQVRNEYMVNVLESESVLSYLRANSTTKAVIYCGAGHTTRQGIPQLLRDKGVSCVSVQMYLNRDMLEEATFDAESRNGRFMLLAVKEKDRQDGHDVYLHLGSRSAREIYSRFSAKKVDEIDAEISKLESETEKLKTELREINLNDAIESVDSANTWCRIQLRLSAIKAQTRELKKIRGEAQETAANLIDTNAETRASGNRISGAMHDASNKYIQDTAQSFTGLDKVQVKDLSGATMYSPELLTNQGVLNVLSTVAEVIDNKEGSCLILVAKDERHKVKIETQVMAWEKNSKVIVTTQDTLAAVLRTLSGLSKIYYKTPNEQDLQGAINIPITQDILNRIGAIIQNKEQFEDFKQAIVNLLQA